MEFVGSGDGGSAGSRGGGERRALEGGREGWKNVGRGEAGRGRGREVGVVLGARRGLIRGMKGEADGRPCFELVRIGLCGARG